ncbi:hypothetical protein K435DRAFT_853352 [Dendrothele bispora CBS 962.96]|uniref:Uncharacterized protein n=1 Tax=Dendrothele bispora (strain CBS 962.96) TaxID=1314807 RepID=A0A4S8MGY9_DENBC|nr:hypothetical protein K435DRAFT_853352 [Dendrothele bispora CBS 962.96]
MGGGESDVLQMMVRERRRFQVLHDVPGGLKMIAFTFWSGTIDEQSMELKPKGLHGKIVVRLVIAAKPGCASWVITVFVDGVDDGAANAVDLRRSLVRHWHYVIFSYTTTTIRGALSISSTLFAVTLVVISQNDTANTFYNDFVAAIQLYRDNRDWVFASNGFQSRSTFGHIKAFYGDETVWADGVDIGEIATFIMEGITIQEEQRPLRRRVAGATSHSGYDDREIRDGELEKERKKLTDRTTTLLKAQATFMPDCWEHVAKSKASNPENKKLILPSDLGAGNRMRLGLEFLAEGEARLHQAHGIVFIARLQYSWTINALNDRKIRALQRTHNNVNAATELLLAQPFSLSADLDPEPATSTFSTLEGASSAEANVTSFEEASTSATAFPQIEESQLPGKTTDQWRQELEEARVGRGKSWKRQELEEARVGRGKSWKRQELEEARELLKARHQSDSPFAGRRAPITPLSFTPPLRTNRKQFKTSLTTSSPSHLLPTMCKNNSFPDGEMEEFNAEDEEVDEEEEMDDEEEMDEKDEETDFGQENEEEDDATDDQADEEVDGAEGEIMWEACHSSSTGFFVNRRHRSADYRSPVLWKIQEWAGTSFGGHHAPLIVAAHLGTSDPLGASRQPTYCRSRYH